MNPQRSDVVQDKQQNQVSSFFPTFSNQQPSTNVYLPVESRKKKPREEVPPPTISNFPSLPYNVGNHSQTCDSGFYDFKNTPLVNNRGPALEVEMLRNQAEESRASTWDNDPFIPSAPTPINPFYSSPDEGNHNNPFDQVVSQDDGSSSTNPFDTVPNRPVESVKGMEKEEKERRKSLPQQRQQGDHGDLARFFEGPPSQKKNRSISFTSGTPDGTPGTPGSPRTSSLNSKRRARLKRQMKEKAEKEVREKAEAQKQTELYKLLRTARDYYAGKNGVEENYAKSMKSYKRAMRKFGQEAVPAKDYVRMGNMNEEGIGRVKAKDHLVLAYSYYLVAAQMGHVLGFSNLGILYEDGLGIEKNVRKAKRMYETAARAGDPYAMCNLGILLERGGRGVKKNPKVAVRWYLKAAKLGFVDGMFNYANMCEFGKGTSRNPAVAQKYYKKAAKKGHQKAKIRLRKKWKGDRYIR